MQYNHYERVRTTLEHKEPDRVPFDLGGAMVTGINVNALRNLKQYLGMNADVQLWDKITQLGVTDDETADRLGVDLKNVAPCPPANPGPAKDLGLVDDHFRLIDEWGMGWQMPKERGHYYDLYLSPLAHVETVREVEAYPWPDPLDPARYEGMKEHADRVVHDEKRAFVLERMSSGMWEHAMWMTGYEKFFVDMVCNKKLVHAIMSKILEIKMQYWEKAMETVGEREYLIISCADDLGGQNGLLVSLDMYRELIWPYHKRLFEFIKSKAKSKAYIFFHNDGAIYETIPLLIEAGVDILNPWQVSPKGMDDTAKFKREYGADLTIWGGSCDTQRVMPFGTPQEVRVETRRRIEDLAPGGGFIFAPIHIIQSEVPPENIVAWWETLQEYGQY